jgi:predicted secreted hydrolase
MASGRAAAGGGSDRPGEEITDPASLATLIAPDGHTERFAPASWRLEETGHWTSPSSHVRYPAGWHLSLSGGGGGGGSGSPASLDLEVTPLLAGQELLLALRYWEGAVVTGGTHGGRPVRGRGYVELTGYGEPPPGAVAP